MLGNHGRSLVMCDSRNRELLENHTWAIELVLEYNYKSSRQLQSHFKLHRQKRSTSLDATRGRGAVPILRWPAAFPPYGPNLP